MGRPAADPLQVGAWLGHAATYDQWIDQLADVEVVHPFNPRVPDDEELVLLGLSPEDIVEVRASRPAVGEDVELWWLWERCVGLADQSHRAWRDNDELARTALSAWPSGAVSSSSMCIWPSSTRLVTGTVSVGCPKKSPELLWRTWGAKDGVVPPDLGGWRDGPSQLALPAPDGPDLPAGASSIRSQRRAHIAGVHRDRPRRLAHSGGHPAGGSTFPRTDRSLPHRATRRSSGPRRSSPRCFPDDGTRVATCQSWLLDQQLLDYLAPTSNIVAFQRRFALWPGHLDGDSDIAEFVFRRDPDSLHDAPQDTTLQRAITTHLESGRHWQLRRGWLSVDRPSQPGRETDRST